MSAEPRPLAEGDIYDWPLDYWDWVAITFDLREAIGHGPNFTALERAALNAATQIERMQGSLI